MADILEVDLLRFEQGGKKARRAVVDGVRRSLETGFVYTSHDLPAEVIDEAYDKLAEFFSMDQGTKSKFVAPGSHGQTGYTGLLVETAASADVPDWKEMLNWSDEPPAGHPLRRKYPHRYMDQVLPEAAVAGITEVLMLFHERIYDLQRRFLRIIAVGLGAHEDLFETMLPYGSTLTRAIRYPPMPEAPSGKTHVWAGEHADINLITALPRATAPGLQVKTDEGWVDAVAPEGRVIINTGMMLEVLSNGVIPPGIHRVVADPSYTGERYSVVQFCHPTPWTILSPLPSCCTEDTPQRYGAIEAGDKLDEVLYQINLVEDARTRERLTINVDPDLLRAELRDWLSEHWDPEVSLVEWRTRLSDAGWACPTWPERWSGRAAPAALAGFIADELERLGAPGLPEGVGMMLAAPTILEHGPDDVRERFLRPTVTGALSWCQLFSEPGAGSDLAGLTTRAELDGDTWIVSGQKVWNTSAHHADYGLLLARTDWDAPKHRGITYFALPMHQPGVEVRPLRQMNGHASFNEVFLDEARVPADHVIGGVGDGWAVALTTLANERRLASHRARVPTTGQPGRAVREAAAEHAIASEPYTWYPQRAGRPDLLVEHAVRAGRNANPVVRQEIARTLSVAEVAKWTAARAVAARALGRQPGPEGSIGKLASSAIAQASAHTHAVIAGASALMTGEESHYAGVIAEVLVSVPAVSIAGGTDEIQHDILAERILGLPREPDPLHGLPYRDVPRNGG